MRAGRREGKTSSFPLKCLAQLGTPGARLGSGRRGSEKGMGGGRLPLPGARFALNTRKETQEAEVLGPPGPVLLPGSRT